MSFRTSIVVMGLVLGAEVAVAGAQAARGDADKPQGAQPAAPSPEAKPAKKAKRKAKPEDAQAAGTATAPAAPAAATAEPKANASAAAAAPKASVAKGKTPTAATTAQAPAAPAAAQPGAATTTTPATTAPAKTAQAAPAAAAAKQTGPKCSIEEPEQPRGGRLDVVGSGFGNSPLVRVAGKPVRMIERREDRLSVQVPADSNGGPVAVQAEGKTQRCGTLVIIGKNR